LTAQHTFTDKGQTMQTIELNLFSFEELTPEAQAVAIEQARYKDWYGDAWDDESRRAIEVFCSHFGVGVKTYSVGAYFPIEYDLTMTHDTFRGVKLRDFSPNHMPTGYCLDCDLWGKFYDVFKATGDAKRAFDDALYAGFLAWRTDKEWQLSDEAIGENLSINEYQFTENGKFWG
jgi:hypothetical protein